MNASDKTTIANLETRVADLENIINLLPQVVRIREQQREESERLRVLGICARRDPDEIRGLHAYDRGRVLATMPDVVGFLLGLEDPLEFTAETPAHARHTIMVRRADLEPHVEVGALAFGSTSRQPQYEINQGELNALDGAGMASMVEMVGGVYAARGLALQYPEVLPRYQYDLLVRGVPTRDKTGKLVDKPIDARLAGWIKDGTITVRELTREELDHRAIVGLQRGVPPLLRRTPRAVKDDPTPATYDPGPTSPLGRLLHTASGEELHDSRRAKNNEKEASQ